ncbi:hypothetical protein evm_010508 [Chilo suppressalis]|nr:hypothetical protein evm_010508 [Chilo suppressalis]
MRVKLAAQVLSHSVTGGLLAKIASNELPPEAQTTATFTQKFDELFDAVNADSPNLRGGKKFSTNMTSRSPHIALFGNMRKFISEMKYLGSKSKPASQDGWIHTMNAIERLKAKICRPSGLKAFLRVVLTKTPWKTVSAASDITVGLTVIPQFNNL